MTGSVAMGNRIPDLIQTGDDGWDSIVRILLARMFVAGFTGFILDNTIKG